MGLDVHDETTSVCVLDRRGKIVEQVVIPTTATAFRRYFRRRSSVLITMEEGPLAAWLYRLLSPRADDVLVCNPRYNRLLRAGVKSDRIDAAKLAELLRLGALRRVHHEVEALALREFAAHYSALVRDTMRVMHRLRATVRGNGVETGALNIYAVRNRRQISRRISSEAVKCRVMALYRQFDALVELREEARAAMLDEAAQHVEFDLLATVPFVGPIRAAQLLACLGGTRQFARCGNLWSYAGLAVRTRSSADHHVEGGRIVARPRFAQGLTRNFNPELKRILKDVALAASVGRGVLRRYFDAQIARGLSAQVARVVLARRIASTVRAILRDGIAFDPSRFTAAIGQSPRSRRQASEEPSPNSRHLPNRMLLRDRGNRAMAAACFCVGEPQ